MPGSDMARYDEITFVLDGPVGESAIDRASRMVEALAVKSPRPVLFARVKLTVLPQTPDHDARAQAVLDVSGALVRAEAVAAGLEQAIDVVADRLDRRLRRLSERRQDRNSRPPVSQSGEWRRGHLSTSRPPVFDRPPEERRLVRHKTYAPEETSVEEALFDLEVMDYRFFLFTDESKNTDAIVFEDDGDLALQWLDGSAERPGQPVPVRVVAAPAPVLSVEEAMDMLGRSDEGFVYFRGSGTDRAAVLYRRYDGHYGLVEPS